MILKNGGDECKEEMIQKKRVGRNGGNRLKRDS